MREFRIERAETRLIPDMKQGHGDELLAGEHGGGGRYTVKRQGREKEPTA